MTTPGPEDRVLVRFRLHLFLSQRHAHRGRWPKTAGVEVVVEAVPARADLPRPGLEHLAVQPLPGQGPLHGARDGAADGSARPALQDAVAVPAEQPARGPAGADRPRRGLGHQPSRGRSMRPSSAMGPTSPTSACSPRSCEVWASTRQRLLARAGTPEIKERLREQTEEAQELGIFGAPSFLAGASCSGATTGSSGPGARTLYCIREIAAGASSHSRRDPGNFMLRSSRRS